MWSISLWPLCFCLCALRFLKRLYVGYLYGVPFQRPVLFAPPSVRACVYRYEFNPDGCLGDAGAGSLGDIQQSREPTGLSLSCACGVALFYSWVWSVTMLHLPSFNIIDDMQGTYWTVRSDPLVILIEFALMLIAAYLLCRHLARADVI